MIKITAKKTYSERVVLDVKNLVFEKGKTYAIIGANGSGKTTLLKILAKQLKGEDVTYELNAKKITYMPQTSYAFSMSVKKNILLACPITDRNLLIRRYRHLVQILGLNKLLRKNASKLSGGETQRMVLARTLLMNSDLLLLDEPTSALDVEQATAVIRLLKEEKSPEKTIILSTHSLKQAEEIADVILFLHNGLLLESGTPEEVLHNTMTEEAKAFISFNR